MERKAFFLYNIVELGNNLNSFLEKKHMNWKLKWVSYWKLYLCNFAKRDLFQLLWFVTHWDTWFRRGTNFHHGLDAGVFAYYRTYGHANENVSFRVVYTMLKVGRI